jgi:hypothetical protein
VKAVGAGRESPPTHHLSHSNNATMDYSDDDDSIEPQAKATKQRKARKPKKDPNKPKKNMNAYFIYSNANRERIKAENPDAKFTELGGIASAEFKALSESEKAKYERLAAADKERYLAEMEDYEPTPGYGEDGGGGPAAKQKKKKDPNAPKRNMNAFFIYSNANRDRLKAENPDAKFTDLVSVYIMNCFFCFRSIPV